MLKRKKKPLLLLAACLAIGLAVAVGGAGSAGAREKRAVTLHEEAVLNLTRESDGVRGEGTVTGTVRGKAHLQMTVEDASHITARFSSEGSGGGITGTAVAHYTVSGEILRFAGSSRITGGSGPYANARGHGIRIVGVMNRSNATMTVTLDGTIRK